MTRAEAIERIMKWGVVGATIKRRSQVTKEGTLEENTGIITQDDLLSLLRSGRKLRVKLGIDPTSKELHLGHAVVLRKLKQFQDLGHETYLIVGDFTALIGDPSGEETTRPALAETQIRKNMAEYKHQASKIIDLKKTKILYNSKWLAKLNFADLIKNYASKMSVNEMIERQDFRRRLKEGKSVALHELLYPLAQAIDSCEIKADVEIGGWDQRLNLLLGRSLQAKLGQPPQQVVLLRPLIGLDGKRKMSSSLNNFIALDEKPNEMFGKLMSIPDSHINEFAELAAYLEDGIDSTAIKRYLDDNFRLAYEKKLYVAEKVVALYWGERKAQRAKETFVETFSRGKVTADLIVDLTYSPGEYTVLEIVKGAVGVSRSQAERLLRQKAVRLEGKLPSGMYQKVLIEKGKKLLLRVGKHRFWHLSARL